MIEGLEEFKRNIEQLLGIDPKPPTMTATLLVQEDAKSNVPVKTGELRGSIYTSVRETEDGIEGICYTNKKYASYVEFGTGPAGEADHNGISPEVAVAYRQTGWMIPADAMSEDEAEAYGFSIAKDSDGKVIGYYTRGQRAQPFMYPALANNKEAIVNLYRQYVQRKIEGLEK